MMMGHKTPMNRYGNPKYTRKDCIASLTELKTRIDPKHISLIRAIDRCISNMQQHNNGVLD